MRKQVEEAPIRRQEAELVDAYRQDHDVYIAAGNDMSTT